MTELKQRVILVPIILQIMSSPTFVKQDCHTHYSFSPLAQACGVPSVTSSSVPSRFWPLRAADFGLAAVVGLVSDFSSSLISLDMKN